MPRKKSGPKAKTYPKAKGPPPQHIRQRFAPAANRDHSPFARSHGYTLAEEARNTASNRGYGGRDARLRYQPVVFISAGFMDPLKEFEIPKQVASSTEPIPTLPSPDVDRDLAPPAPSHGGLVSQDINQAAHAELSQPQGEHLADIPDIGSDSSEEIILFKGRNNRHRRQTSPSSKPAENRNDSMDTTTPHEIKLESTFVKETVDVSFTSGSAPQTGELDFISLDSNPRKRLSSRKRPNTDSNEDDDEAAIIADYIANMQVDLEDGDESEEDIGRPSIGAHSFSILRDLGGTDSDAIPSQPSSGDESGDELDDEAEERQFESEDEHLAHLLAKQEELGLGSDDIILFDGANPSDGWVKTTNIPCRKKKSAVNKSKMFQGGSQFPSATRMAQAFDELDLMDIQKSRVQRSKKGPVFFGLPDSELEDALNAAVQKDRLKKAAKKKAREELRSQGLLGKNVNPHDLRVKYQGGMSLDDLADEIEAFVLGDQEQLILPPFDKGARKIIHVIANTFNIKSKSAGAGIGRYPVLYRTKTTLPYDEVLFEQAFSRVRRTWFPRVDVDEKVAQRTRVLRQTEIRTGKSRTGKSSLTLREGDIVGQHASEIGVENKGRAMLEKMGWSKGMSLGTVETKGITVPLMHVIKKTKAGLGDT
ncbi:putative g-patch domain-containing protein [Rosellinia necatrix]|uniref:Protein SQS1 n=1 Tax=Rosellinia necatrix TaxID=77044 RepID=A0A1W2TN77_ROSNE|nr:putative g-patch domain-containing protein [Rosellinia necatrix]